MKKLVVVLALVVGAWLFFSSNDKFACADDNSCPATAEDAAGNSAWAAARLDTILEKDRTAGLFYDEDGTQHEFSSGREDISERIEKHLRSSGRVPMPPVGQHPTITHVEAKVAMTMREADVDRGVLVINHPEGPCPGVFSCGRAIEVLLARDASLTIWWRQDGQMRTTTFVGKD